MSESVGGTAGGVRGHRFEVRLSVGEFAVLAAAARAAGFGRVAGWARGVLLAQAQGGGVVEAAGGGGVDVLLGQVRGELVRIGSNLNQVARALNAAVLAGGPGPGLGEVLAVVEVTRAGLGGVRDALRAGTEVGG